MAVLEMLNGDSAGRQFRLDEPRMVLGRHPDCDIVLEVGAVSRQHAKISKLGNEYQIEDLHSRNGTFVNGEQIQGSRVLQDGDRVKICDLTFTFSQDQSPLEILRRDDLNDTSLASAMFVEDGDRSNSTIMSRLDIAAGAGGGMRLTVNAEMKLRALIEITQSLSRALVMDEVLPKLIDSLFKIFIQADRGFVVLKGPDGSLLPKVVRHRRPENEDTIRISRTIVSQVMNTRQAILSADAASDTRFEMSQSIADFRIRSMMCAPLVDGEGNALGVIQVDTLDQRNRFQQEDLDVLASVASQAAFAIDNAQLHERSLKQQQVQRDLELAHKVQRGLLPVMPPVVKGYHFYDFYEAANQVGGDYYDYVHLTGGRVAIVLADVSGKGVSAALVMAKLSAEVRYCLATEPTPAQAVNRINATFCSHGWDDRFVTLVLLVLDPATHELTIVNAGHMPPLVRRGEGRVEPVAGDLAGIPLGVSEDYLYEQEIVRLESGNFAVTYTDGISEAMNAASELYGYERLNAQVGSCVTDVKELGRCILDDVKQFVAGQPQSDDMCIVCFGRGED